MVRVVASEWFTITGLSLGTLVGSRESLSALDGSMRPWTFLSRLLCWLIQPTAMAAGAFRGSLAVIFARQNKIEDAWSLLEEGETQTGPYPETHARFLCCKGKVDDARLFLEQAKGLAFKLGLGSESDVEQAVRE